MSDSITQGVVPPHILDTQAFIMKSVEEWGNGDRCARLLCEEKKAIRGKAGIIPVREKVPGSWGATGWVQKRKPELSVLKRSLHRWGGQQQKIHSGDCCQKSCYHSFPLCCMHEGTKCLPCTSHLDRYSPGGAWEAAAGESSATCPRPPNQ